MRKRDTVPEESELKTITPSRLHVPPFVPLASHSVRGGVPERSTLFSLPPAKKARNRLSGDQNGNVAPSLPFTVCALRRLSARSQMTLPLSDETIALK